MRPLFVLQVDRTSARHEIDNSITGLRAYLSALNIRNKCKHPLFLVLRFSACVGLWYDATRTLRVALDRPEPCRQHAAAVHSPRQPAPQLRPSRVRRIQRETLRRRGHRCQPTTHTHCADPAVSSNASTTSAATSTAAASRRAAARHVATFRAEAAGSHRPLAPSPPS